MTRVCRVDLSEQESSVFRMATTTLARVVDALAAIAIMVASHTTTETPDVRNDGAESKATWVRRLTQEQTTCGNDQVILPLTDALIEWGRKPAQRCLTECSQGALSLSSLRIHV